MPNLRAVLFGAAALFFGAAPAWTQGCRPDEVIITSSITVESIRPVSRFSVEIADDPQERALGLMHRTEMPRSHGMLFLYEKPGPVSFWMENTLIPLDMIFVDRRGVVVTVHENAIPLDRTPIPGGEAVFAVLEINAGLSKLMKIRPGDVIRHPGFGPEAEDSCFSE